ncbi:hypothetical protein GCM10010109_81490 [Actinoplanes campanulatus]|nr:hypothetical protein GCM10010109_81490 [Actinoplanes campanulatus]GID41254.1 hypothetical protein Aca09nite_77600 [Actinoplanes campanulatus]
MAAHATASVCGHSGFGRPNVCARPAGEAGWVRVPMDGQGRKLARYSVGLRVVSWRKAALKADREV